MSIKLLVATIAAILGIGASSGVAGSSEFKLVINPANPATSVTRKQLAEIFLKRTSHWGDGSRVLPVDLKYDSPVRENFSKAILGKAIRSVKAYWQQQVFGGHDIPPPEKATDPDVIRYVSENPGAIGYVSTQVEVGAGVKQVPITDMTP